MTHQKRLILALLLTLAVWFPITWPLPSHFSEAIPVGASKRDGFEQNLIRMQAGDHLQFIYYLWIASDYLSGKTPFFYNLYEFNTGDDAERYRPGSYYFPFSLAYALLYWATDRVVAWNALNLFVLWLGCWSAWLLARRYTARESIAALAAAFAILFPYQWIQLLGGSPAGFGMALIPLLLLGLDRAVRDEKRSGGWLAGVAIFCAAMTDTHAVFFGILAIPTWCLLAFSQRDGFAVRSAAAWFRLARPLIPVAVMVLLAFLHTQSGTRHVTQSHTAGGRSVNEVLLYSPHPHGLWTWSQTEVSYHIYFGFVLTALLLAGGVLILGRARRDRSLDYRRRAVLIAALGLATIFIVWLAMGPNAPPDGLLFRWARRLIPGYGMIRQPAKIFLLLPALLTVALTLSLDAVADRLRLRSTRGLALAVGVLLFAEYFFQVKPVISLMDSRNAAYAAVAHDAVEHAEKPRALILPLWPGDSHQTAVYQYYASLYRIRMVNGYRPYVPQDYVRDVFEQFKSLTQGSATEAQLDALLVRGIGHLVLHEDMYPEQVSTFPVATALARLLNHPRLALLGQDGPTWAFRILANPDPRPTALATNWVYHFPPRNIEMERQTHTNSVVQFESEASAGSFVHLAGNARLTVKPLTSIAPPNTRWWLRIRGEGDLLLQRSIDGTPLAPLTVPVAAAEWSWIEFPAGEWPETATAGLELSCPTGHVDVDVAKFGAGKWTTPAPGEAIHIPAPCFFHAGHIDLATDTVQFDPTRDRKGIVFYGPKLPLAPGTYRIEVAADVESAASGYAGFWVAACPEGNELKRADMRATDRPLRIEVDIPNNQPFLLAFVYAGEESVRIRELSIARLR